jgi:hypothetical protein
MASFTGQGAARTPFGKNVYLRSTKGCLFESYTVAASTVPSATIDGSTQKILQPGTVMAKITSGADAGKIGPFQASVTDGRQTLANIVGLLDTFAPWQFLERDVECAVMYHGTAVQGWCFEYDAGGLPIVLTNTTADACRGTKGLDINFK